MMSPSELAKHIEKKVKDVVLRFESILSWLISKLIIFPLLLLVSILGGTLHIVLWLLVLLIAASVWFCLLPIQLALMLFNAVFRPRRRPGK